LTPATSPRVHRHGWRLLIPAVLAFVFTGLAAISAYTTWGKPFPSLLVDPYRFYSIVELPSWESPALRPQAHDRLLSINGVPLRAEEPVHAHRELKKRLAEIPPGHAVTLEFESSRGRYTIRVPVRTFGGEETLFLFITYVLVAWVVLWSGGMVFTVGGRPAARRAYTFWSAVTFLFLVSFYDYHTNGWLSPLFSVATVGIPLGALWLAYAFPEPPRRGRSALRGVLVAVTLLGVAVALGLALAPWLGWDFRVGRQVLDHVIGPCVATLALAVLLRLRRSQGLDRVELLTAFSGLVMTPLMLALIQVVALATGRDVRHVALPFIVLIFPLAIGYALVRNNILKAQVVFTVKMLMIPVCLGAILVSVLGAYSFHRAVGATSLKVSLAAGVALFILTMVFARMFQERLLFHATLAFRGTIEGLRDQLSSLRDRPAIRQAVEEMVVKAIPIHSARILEPATVAALPHVPPGTRAQLDRGETVWTAQSPREQHLLLPMRSLGELRAVLFVGPKREGALFTQEDFHLLETIAGLVAMALHNVEVVQELESFRRLEVGAAHDEKRLALGALGTEVSHELVYPLNFLRDLLRRGRDQALDEEDLFFAREEIGRMERMIHSLRRLELPSPRIGVLPLLASTQRALTLLRELLREKELSVSVEVPPEVTVNAEEDSLVQLLSNLLRNAAQATPRGGAIGIRHRQAPARQIIEVWDTGPGIPEEVAGVLFTCRISTREEGYGIGLTVVHRIARSFHWEVSFQRDADRTLFLLTIPAP
jgi:signal transduction histidine kinase